MYPECTQGYHKGGSFRIPPTDRWERCSPRARRRRRSTVQINNTGLSQWRNCSYTADWGRAGKMIWYDMTWSTQWRKLTQSRFYDAWFPSHGTSHEKMVIMAADFAPPKSLLKGCCHGMSGYKLLHGFLDRMLSVLWADRLSSIIERLLFIMCTASMIVSSVWFRFERTSHSAQ